MDISIIHQSLMKYVGHLCLNERTEACKTFTHRTCPTGEGSLNFSENLVAMRTANEASIVSMYKIVSPKSLRISVNIMKVQLCIHKYDVT